MIKNPRFTDDRKSFVCVFWFFIQDTGFVVTCILLVHIARLWHKVALLHVLIMYMEYLKILAQDTHYLSITRLCDSQSCILHTFLIAPDDRRSIIKVYLILNLLFSPVFLSDITHVTFWGKKKFKNIQAIGLLLSFCIDSVSAEASDISLGELMIKPRV